MISSEQPEILGDDRPRCSHVSWDGCGSFGSGGCVGGADFGAGAGGHVDRAPRTCVGVTKTILTLPVWLGAGKARLPTLLPQTRWIAAEVRRDKTARRHESVGAARKSAYATLGRPLQLYALHPGPRSASGCIRRLDQSNTRRRSRGSGLSCRGYPVSPARPSLLQNPPGSSPRSRRDREPGP